MARNDNNGNGSNRSTPAGGVPSVGKKPTRDDLVNAIEKARDAAEASAAASEVVLAAMGIGSPPDDVEDEDMPQYSSPEGDRPGAGGPNANNRHPVGDGAHLGLEEFMARLQGVLKQVGGRVAVTENASFLKLESRVNGHKVYLSKGKTVVGRVESTLPVDQVTGAVPAEKPNGRIASWIPADVNSVAEAVRRLASDKTEPVRAPIRGGVAGNAGSGGPGGAGSGRAMPRRYRVLN